MRPEQERLLNRSDVQLHVDDSAEQPEQKCCPKVNRKLMVPKGFYFCFFAAWGSLLPYMALYFKQLLLNPSEVGVLMGLKPFVNFFVIPIWGAVVDKFHIQRLALTLSLIALIISTFSICLVPSPEDTRNIVDKHCNKTDGTLNLAILEPEIDKMVLDDGTTDYHFSREHASWPLDLAVSFAEDVNAKFSIDASKTFTALFLIILFGTLIGSPTLALVDTATLQMLGKETFKYGRQRLTGSLGWGMGAFIVGASLQTTHSCNFNRRVDLVDYMPCFYAFAVLMVLGLLVSFKFKFGDQAKTGKETTLRDGLQVLGSPSYIMFLITALYLGFLMAFIKTFLFWHLKDLGASQLLFSMISAVNCVAEVSMYFLSEKLITYIGQTRVLYLGLICYSIRLFYYSIIPSPWLVLLVELLPGITSAAVWAACLSYVSINSRPGSQTTMQCILHGIHWGLGYGLGEVIGGILVHNFGAPLTFVMHGCFCIVILLVYLVVERLFGQSAMPRTSSSDEMDSPPVPIDHQPSQVASSHTPDSSSSQSKTRSHAEAALPGMAPTHSSGSRLNSLDKLDQGEFESNGEAAPPGSSLEPPPGSINSLQISGSVRSSPSRVLESSYLGPVEEETDEPKEGNSPKRT